MSVNDNNSQFRDFSQFIPFDNLDDSCDTFISKIAGIDFRRGAYDLEEIENAYRFAYVAHENQKRKSGDPYIVHPVAVSITLAKLNQDTATVCAALLHDVIEDTGYDYDSVKNKFGKEIADIVDGVTKVSGAEKEAHKEQYAAETYRKIILATSKNPRTIMVKLADRIHNLSTLESLEPKRQKAIAAETLDIYAPIALEIGAYSIKTILEDMSMKYALPDEYDLVCQKTDAENEINAKLSQKFCKKIKDILSASHLEGFEVSGRVKSVYSIYRKHIDREVPYEEIYDIVGCRIICREELDCYRILGILHNTWHPLGDKIKDYIASPKLNGYRSLHTTLIDNETGNQVEVQIRTYVMDLEAEYGFASHIAYKDKGKRVGWLDEFPLWEKEFTDSSEFLSLLKSNISASEITIYTKKSGEAVKLPEGAVVLDLAYSFGENEGSRCNGAIIDGKLEPIDRKLFNNETVELLTSTDSKPSVEWLSVAKTPKAKTSIKKRLRQTEIDEKTNQAFNLLINSYDYLKEPISFNEYKKNILKFFGLLEEKNLYDKIYSGEVTTDDILSFTMTMTREINDHGKMSHLIKGKHKHHRLFIDSLKRSNTIRSAICCTPIPGDKIIGFRTNGDRGISVHRADCPTALLFADDMDRVIYCDWAVGNNLGMFSEEITVLGIDSDNILLDVIKLFADKRIKYSDLDFYKGNGVARLLVKVEIRNVRELFALMSEIKKKKGISSVHRNLVPRKIA